MDYDNKGYITIKDLRKYFKVKSKNFYVKCFESTNSHWKKPQKITVNLGKMWNLIIFKTKNPGKIVWNLEKWDIVEIVQF